MNGCIGLTLAISAHNCFCMNYSLRKHSLNTNWNGLHQRLSAVELVRCRHAGVCKNIWECMKTYRFFLNLPILRVLLTDWLCFFYLLLLFTKARVICLTDIKVYTCTIFTYHVLTKCLVKRNSIQWSYWVTKKSSVIVQTIHIHLNHKKYFSDHNQHLNQGDLFRIIGFVSSKLAKTYSGTNRQRLWRKHGRQYFLTKIHLSRQWALGCNCATHVNCRTNNIERIYINYVFTQN